MKYGLTLIFFLLFKSLAIGDSVLDSMFQEGKDAYISGKFEQAMEKFKKISGSGFLSGDIYFNIGNCYYKLGQLGHAILYYEKSLRLNKRNAEIRNNLEFTKSILKEKFEEEPVSFFLVPLRWTQSVINQWEACFICVLLAWLLLVALSILLLCPARFSFMKLFISILVLLQIFFVVVCYDIYRNQVQTSTGIAVKGEIQIRSGPSETFPVGLVLHEGAKIRILSEQGMWSKVALPNGFIGWIQSNSYELI